eukprot:3299803-Pleurochrysis_carterae.AAC.2
MCELLVLALLFVKKYDTEETAQWVKGVLVEDERAAAMGVHWVSPGAKEAGVGAWYCKGALLGESKGLAGVLTYRIDALRAVASVLHTWPHAGSTRAQLPATTLKGYVKKLLEGALCAPAAAGAKRGEGTESTRLTCASASTPRTTSATGGLALSFEGRPQGDACRRARAQGLDVRARDQDAQRLAAGAKEHRRCCECESQTG